MRKFTFILKFVFVLNLLISLASPAGNLNNKSFCFPSGTVSGSTSGSVTPSPAPEATETANLNNLL